jgi:hypothetical protein
LNSHAQAGDIIGFQELLCLLQYTAAGIGPRLDKKEGSAQQFLLFNIHIETYQFLPFIFSASRIELLECPGLQNESGV